MTCTQSRTLFRRRLVIGGVLAILLVCPLHLFLRAGLAILAIAALATVDRLPRGVTNDQKSGAHTIRIALAGLWDFLFGSIVIGGAPLGCSLAIISVTSFLLDRALPHGFSSAILDNTITTVLVILALAAFVLTLITAIRFRQQRRILPAAWIAGEVVLGLVLTGVYGMVFIFITAMSALA